MLNENNFNVYPINWMSINHVQSTFIKISFFHYKSNSTDDCINFWINFVINICWNICQWRVIIQVLVQSISETDDIFGAYISNCLNWLTSSVDIFESFWAWGYFWTICHRAPRNPENRRNFCPELLTLSIAMKNE